MKSDLTETEHKGLRIFLSAGAVVLALIFLFQFGVHHHAHFESAGVEVDTKAWFFPLYGFGGALLLVLFSKTLAIALKRKDTFYADD